MKNDLEAKTIRLLSKRQKKSNRKKNHLIIVAIILTTVLFTSIFTIGGSMLKTIQTSKLKAAGTTSQVCYKALSMDEYLAISQDKKVKESSYNVIIAAAENEELKKIPTEIRYSEELDAKWWYSYPEVGKLPEAENELATSLIVLQALGIRPELGQTVTLDYTVKGELLKKEFQLCGFWTGNEYAGAQQVLLSKTYSDKIAPIATIPLREMEFPEYAGTIFLDVNFTNTWNLEEKSDDLLERCGYTDKEINVSINEAYLMSNLEVDGNMVVLILALLGVIFLAGAFIIYNIFSLTIVQDIRFYGLIKTLGATKGQIKALVRKQIMWNGLIGIPLGLVIGWFSGSRLLPYVSRFFSGIDELVVGTQPWIFLLSAVISYATLFISCYKPSYIARTISPIEAVRYTDCNTSIDLHRKSRTRLNPFTMARSNLVRMRKKVLIVVVSLSLSMVILNGVYMLVRSMNIDNYLEGMIDTDFVVTDWSLLDTSSLDKVLDSIDTDMKSAIRKVDGLTEYSEVYVRDAYYPLNNLGMSRAMNCIEYIKEKYNYPDLQDLLVQTKETKQIRSFTYGVDEWLLSKLKLVAGTIDVTKFKDGNSIIVNSLGVDSNGSIISYYNIGEKIELNRFDGQKKEYEVVAIANIPTSFSTRYSYIVQPEFILYSKEYQSVTGNEKAAMIAFNVKKESKPKVESWLSNDFSKQYPQIRYESKLKYEKEFRQMKLSYIVIGGILSFILAVVGILNFINSMKTSIYARNREFAIFQAIGMTDKQLKRMIVAEGVYYALGTLAVTLTIGMVFDYMMVSLLADFTGSAEWSFTIFPVILYFVVILLCNATIPMIFCKKVKETSLVDRIRFS